MDHSPRTSSPSYKGKVSETLDRVRIVDMETHKVGEKAKRDGGKEGNSLVRVRAPDSEQSKVVPQLCSQL